VKAIRLQRVRLAPGALDHELVWSVLFFCALIIVAFLPGHIMGRFHCFFFSLTGLPCPTCGITRTVQALAAGNIDAAFSLSSFFAAVLLICVCLAFYGLAISLLNLKRLRFIFSSEQGPRLFALALLSPFFIHWIFNMLRACH